MKAPIREGGLTMVYLLSTGNDRAILKNFVHCRGDYTAKWGCNPMSKTNRSPAQVLQPAFPAEVLDRVDERIQKPVPWIIERLLAEEEQMLLYGAPKVGKSQFALQLALAVATGRPFLHWNIPKRQKVLYVNLEIGEQMFMRRVACHLLGDSDPAWKAPDFEAMTDGDRDRLNAMIEGCFFFTIGVRSMDLLIEEFDSGKREWRKSATKPPPDSFPAWRRLIESVRPSLVVFDTLSKMHSIDEKDNSRVQRLLMRIRKLAALTASGASGDNHLGGERHLAHVVVHHSRKGFGGKQNGGVQLDDIRGGSAIRAEADVIFGLGTPATSKKGKSDSDADDEPRGDGLTKRLIVLEARNLPELAPEHVFYSFDGWVFRSSEKKAVQPQKAVSEVPDPATKIRGFFLEWGVRGISEGEIPKEISGKKQGPEYDRWKAQLQALVASEPPILKYCKKDELRAMPGFEEALLYPLMGKGSRVYWIHENSPWLDAALQKKIECTLATERAKAACVSAPTQSRPKRRRKRARKKPRPRSVPITAEKTPLVNQGGELAAETGGADGTDDGQQPHSAYYI